VLTKAQGELDFGEGDPMPGGGDSEAVAEDGIEPAQRRAARAPKRPELRGITGGKKGRRK
jgi:hypothetical protein